MTPPKIIDVGPIHMVDLLAPVQQDDCAIAIYRLRGGSWERVATYNRETKKMI